MTKWIGVAVLTFFAVAALNGCATADLRPVADTTKKPKPVTAPAKSCPRELGSLWCVNSDWNDIYSEVPNRVPGDTILVKFTPRFLMQVTRRLKRNFPLRVSSKVENVERGKPKVEVKVQPTSDALAPDDTQQLYMTVTEVLPRYLYKVKAQETIRLGGREPILTLEGEIRNRDIQGDESISVDALMNSAFDVKPYGGDREIAAEESQDKT